MRNEPDDPVADKPSDLYRCVLYPLAFFAAISIVMVGPFVVPANRIDSTSYDVEDSYIFMWNFWWTKTAVFSGSNPYWTDAVFYPAGTSLTFHSYPLLYSLASIPIQLAIPGLDGLTVSFNLAVFASFVVAGFAAYRLALHVTGSLPGSLVAGLIYAFMPFHLLNAARLHVVAIEFLPFYVLAYLRMESSPRFRNALAMGFWLAVNYYTSLEYALYLVLFSCVRLAWTAVFRGSTVTWKYLAHLGLSALLFVLISGPLIYQQVQLRLSSGWQTIARPVEEAAAWSPALASFVTPSRGNPIYGAYFAFAGSYHDGRTVGMRSETTLCFTALALAAIAIASTKRDGRSFWGLAFVLFLVCSLGPYLRISGTWTTEIPLPWLALYESLPPFRAGREPARFFPLAMLMVALLAALGVGRIWSWSKSKRVALVLTSLVGFLVLFEDLTRWPVYRITPLVHPAFRRLAAEAGDFAVMDLTRESDRLLSHTVHQKNTVDWKGFVVRSEQIRRATPLALLQLEFEQPRRLLGSGAAGRAQIEQFKQPLMDANVRYIFLPAEGDPACFQLAQLLGAEITVEGSIVVCRFEHPLQDR